MLRLNSIVVPLTQSLLLLFCLGDAHSQTVAITEFIKSPSPGSNEWVELYNYGTSVVDLSNWTIEDDDDDLITIPAGTQLPAKHFLVCARDKRTFEENWLKGKSSPSVIQYDSTLQMSDTGPDEVKLKRPGVSTAVWRLAYGASVTDNRAIFFAMDDFSITNHGSKSQVISVNGVDSLTGQLGYESNQYTTDLQANWVYTAGNDYGSPLRGHYTGAANPPPPPDSWIVDLTVPGKAVNPGVRGLAIADQALNRGDNTDKTGILPSLQIARGSALRGVAGGLYADMYDWKRRNDMPRPPTLEFQRWARDFDCELYVTANTRGLTIPDPNLPSHRIYYTSDTAVLATLAADWVRYTNHIVQTYRQGDVITDPRDAAILDELTWSSSYVNTFGTADQFTKLLEPGEAAVPPVTYWEIGNEPTVSLANPYSVTNAFTFTNMPGEYRDRYIAISHAMIAEDPSIKVGPCIVNARSTNNILMLKTLLESNAKIDFISYHPYGSMGDWPADPLRQQRYLAGAYAEQELFFHQIKDMVAQYRPAEADTMRYIASETNVSDFRTNNTFQEGTMAHALGCVETVMSYARLGLDAAHYWIWITATPTYLADTNRFAATMAWEKMRDELGDELVGVFDENDEVHVYVLRASETEKLTVWALNFSHTSDHQFHLSLIGGPTAGNTIVKKSQLRAISGGATNLFSVNLNPEINNAVARRDVDWTPTELLPDANPIDLDIILPAATITLVTVEKSETSNVDHWSLY